MPEITKEQIQKAYDVAKRVYEKNLTQTQGKEDVMSSVGMNKNSAGDYIVGFKCMMDGIEYKRTVNQQATKYLLENIYKDYGKTKLKSALYAVQQHINYYATSKKSKLPSIQKIHDEYLKILKNKTWVIALGKDAFNLEIDYKDGLISIGWDDIGDIKQYTNKEQIKFSLNKNDHRESEDRRNDVLACYEFAYEISIGDLVLIRHKTDNIVGYGYVCSDYKYDATRDIHKHVREFSWTHQGKWQLTDSQFPNKTLTNITDRSDLSEITGLINIVDQEFFYPDTDLTTEQLKEGTKNTSSTVFYERNSRARDLCLHHYGYNCSVCKMEFERKYGDIGKGFIHVHHLTEISSIREEYYVDPIKDLRPVCPNCHAMLHKRKPAYSIEELKKIYERLG